jgi:hypothetical protein
MRGKSQRRVVMLTTILLAACAGRAAPAAASHSKTEKGKTLADRPHSFTLKITTDRTYLAGFPLIVEVEVRNIDPNLITASPFFDLFTVPGPVSLSLVRGGREWTWEGKLRNSESGSDGIDFGPGQAWLAIQDLSELHPDIPPGHYQLSASILFPGELVKASPVELEIATVSKEDKAIASRLRTTNDREKSSWHAFVRHNWSTPATSGLSAVARAHLAFYLFLHRVTYGPQPVSALNSELPWQFGKGVLEGEAALLRLEILHAARRPEAAGVEAAILERWPGFAWWVGQIRNGHGPLRRLRTGDGVESIDAPTDKPRPYQK